MRWSWGLIGAMACGEVESAQRPPPPALTGLTRATSSEVVVTGARPGGQVWVLASSATGAGPCPPVFAGGCLDLASPVTLLGWGTADASGAATVAVVAPPELPDDVFVQAGGAWGTTPLAPATVGDPAVWTPAPGTTWQWQLQGTIDTSFDVEMYDVDLFDTPTAVIDQLHADGRAVVCYLSAGSWESWRSDAAAFPVSTRGQPLDGWPGERWLDIRNVAVRNALEARLDLAAARGCDAVEPDNVDGYTNNTGFPLRAADQLAFNRFLAAEAHARGLSVGLKNDVGQLAALVGWFDWALNEECYAYAECRRYQPFVAAGKAVFHVEYPAAGEDPAALAAQVCAVGLPFETLIKPLLLGPERYACAP
jgi:hypothetical protein